MSNLGNHVLCGTKCDRRVVHFDWNESMVAGICIIFPLSDWNRLCGEEKNASYVSGLSDLFFCSDIFLYMADQRSKIYVKRYSSFYAYWEVFYRT